MNRPIARCLLATLAILSIPASALATPEVGQKNNGYSICDEQALKLYAEGMKAGFDFGRNRIEDGKLLASGEVIPEPRPCEWRDYLDGQLHPPEPVEVATVSSTGYVAPTTTVAPVAPSGDLSSIAACESGGDPTAVSPDGTYRGLYQFDSSTWSSVGGSGDPAAASAEEQTMRAQMLMDSRGTSPWPVCGG